MSLCTCPERPRCQYHHCRAPADWSFFTPPGRWIKTWPYGRLHFMCTPCKDYYAGIVFKLLKGLDRPENAGEEWRGSLLDHLRHAQIAIAFEKRNEKQIPPDPSWHDDAKRYTPAQLKQVMILRKHLRNEQRQ